LAADEKITGANARNYFETAAGSLARISGTAVQTHAKCFETAKAAERHDIKKMQAMAI
jgi:hypothetical protein